MNGKYNGNNKVKIGTGADNMMHMEIETPALGYLHFVETDIVGCVHRLLEEIEVNE